MKFLKRVVGFIWQVLALPRQTTIFDDNVSADEEIDAQIDVRLLLEGTEHAVITASVGQQELNRAS